MSTKPRLYVAFTGAHGTGKSTLVDAITKKLQAKLGYREVVSTLSLARMMKASNHALGTSAYNQLQLEMLCDHQLELYKDKVVVGSRSVVDRICNSYEAGLLPTDAELTRYYEIRLEEQIAMYDLLIYVPIEFNVVDDGVRDLSETRRRNIDERISDLLRQSHISHLKVTGTVDERVAQIWSKLEPIVDDLGRFELGVVGQGLHAPKKVGDAGFDLVASEETWLEAGEAKLVPVESKMAIPKGYFASIRGRSSMNRRKLFVMTGAIDQGYTGDLSPLIVNLNPVSMRIEKGDRVAQVIFEHLVVPKVRAISEDQLPSTERGAKGFGSTGK